MRLWKAVVGNLADAEEALRAAQRAAEKSVWGWWNWESGLTCSCCRCFTVASHRWTAR